MLTFIQEEGGEKGRVTLVSHILSSSIWLFTHSGMRTVGGRGRQETVNTGSLPRLQLSTKPKLPLSWLPSHTHAVQSMKFSQWYQDSHFEMWFCRFKWQSFWSILCLNGWFCVFEPLDTIKRQLVSYYNGTWSQNVHLFRSPPLNQNYTTAAQLP